MSNTKLTVKKQSTMLALTVFYKNRGGWEKKNGQQKKTLQDTSQHCILQPGY